MRTSLCARCMLLPLVAGVLAGCIPTSAPQALPTQVSPPSPISTPAPTPTETLPMELPARAVISEVVPGLPGDNNHEFIELYNGGTEALDLRGWSLWYRLNESQDEQRVYRWPDHATVPGLGHHLLVREGTELAVLPDATFDLPLFERWGGLQLRDAAGQVVDAMAWGRAIAGYTEGRPALAPADGASVERLPGGSLGNGLDTEDGASDFTLRPEPNPQNSGSDTTPLPEERLAVYATSSLTVTPGTPFVVNVSVDNLTTQDLTNVRVTVPLPEGVIAESLALTEGAESEGFDLAPSSGHQVISEVTWTVPVLRAGATNEAALFLRSPWRYGTFTLSGYRVEAEDWPLGDVGPVVLFSVAGGAIPIGTARTLLGNEVTVEGVVTMYTGGFFAGSTGTKFYVQDETGGIQVYCPGGQSQVTARLGDRIRVTGGIEVYRDSVELVPSVYPDDVLVIESGAGAVAPTVVSVLDATREEAVLGSLVAVEGAITRFEEFSYSYELDLVDDSGDVALIYIEKDTGLNPEFIELGDRYRIAGISEVYDGQRQVKPRIEDDFARIYPKALLVDIRAPNSVAAGGSVTYTIAARNYTDNRLLSAMVTATLPLDAVDLTLTSGEPVTTTDDVLSWRLPALPPGGGSALVTAGVRLKPSVTEGSFVAAITATAGADIAVIASQPWRTFVGSGVPIWAIQGTGPRSPFALSDAATEGVITGIFPEQGGLWIQSIEPDDDASTSEGLFVRVDLDPEASDLRVGQRVVVEGRVRERSGQTMLDVPSLSALNVVTDTDALPAPVSLYPPLDDAASRAYYETLEGMLVEVSGSAVAVGPTSQYGETPLVLAATGIDRLRRGDATGALIFVDDGSAVRHLDRSTLPYAAKTGDTVTDLVGPLAYTFENFKIQPVITPTVVSRPHVLPSLAPLPDGAFSIATFNVENLFDLLDPHPSDLERPGIREYLTHIDKLAATLVSMGAPTVVGLQEVENIGVLQDVVEHELVAIYRYQPLLIEGFDSRGIDVGYLVRGDIATVEGVSQHDAPEGLTSRPPLMVTVTVQLAGGDQTVTLLNNHFTSMSGGELPTEPRRMAQAEWNASLVAPLLAADPDAKVVVLGDLNSFYDSPPLDLLREAGLRHVYEIAGGNPPYTYVYQGVSETLDHILVSPALFDQLRQVGALHVNADYPLAVPGDLSPERLSDHDPLVAVFSPD